MATDVDIQGRQIGPGSPIDYAIGGNQAVDLIAGMSGVVGKVDAAIGEIQSTASDLRGAVDQAVRYMGATQDQQNKMLTAIQQAVTDTTTAVIQQIQPMIAQTGKDAAVEIHKTLTGLAEKGGLLELLESRKGGVAAPTTPQGGLRGEAQRQAPEAPQTARARQQGADEQLQGYHSH